ncbi:hypothetical protein LEJE111609_04645 [Lelliottia jeotgali]|jgi:hypothetical protein
MIIVVAAVLVSLLVVLGLNYILQQLMSAWCDPDGH